MRKPQMINIKQNIHNLLCPVLALTLACLLTTIGAQAESGGTQAHIERQDWSFAGPFGKYDKAQLQRGFGVYQEVCSACHSLKLLSYRNLVQRGGPEFSAQQALAIAKEATVIDGFDDEGEPKEREGKLSDRFQSPYANDPAGRSANNGALPPDFSVIVKARTYHRHAAWYMEPAYWLYDIATTYEEKGADYIFALLQGYVDAPHSFKLGDGMNYNTVFAGNQIAMANPLSDEAVDYADGTKPTAEQHARDVVAFLAWASEPTLNERKSLGKRVIFYLLILALLLYLAKRSLWSRIEH